MTPIALAALVAAAFLAWVFGAAWYGVLGRVWRDALRSRRDVETDTGQPPVKALIISFFAELLMAFVLSGLIPYFPGAGIQRGLVLGFFCWLGFAATTLVTSDAYLREKLTKTAIDAGHWLGVLLIQGAILGALV